MTARPAHLADYLTQHLAGPSTVDDGTQRQDHLLLENASAQGPVNLLEADQVIDDLRRELRLRQLVRPADNQPVVDEGILKRLQDALEIPLRQAGVANLRDEILVRQRI